MEHEILNHVTAVQQRRKSNVVLRSAMRGLCAGSALALGLGLLRWLLWALGLGPFLQWSGVSLGVTCFGGVLLVIGLAIGLRRGARCTEPRQDAAAAIDAHYRLNDRTVTALGFLEKPARRPLEQMQIAEATTMLAEFDAKTVVPTRVPKSLFAALVLLAAAAALLFGPVGIETTEEQVVNEVTEPSAEPPAAEPDAPPEAAAASRQYRAELGWKAAPSGTILSSRANLLAGRTLREVIRRSEDRPQDPTAAAPKTTFQAEFFPLEHRRLIRAYFESIRPGEDQFVDEKP